MKEIQEKEALPVHNIIYVPNKTHLITSIILPEVITLEIIILEKEKINIQNQATRNAVGNPDIEQQLINSTHQIKSYPVLLKVRRLRQYKNLNM